VPGLAAVPIEEIDADAFEARRQTYVRNLSGEWHKVKLGRMFVEMLNTLVVSSNRELAAQLGITEGTVRNTILYSTAAKLAAERDDAPDEEVIAMMSVREVRKLLAWLMGDADQEEGDQAAAAAPEARILARLKRAWNKATEEERAEFLAWTGYVTHQARNGYAEPPYERQMDIEDMYPEPPAQELADEQLGNGELRNGYADDPVELGRRVREARKAKGWTHGELAEAAGTHAPTVSQIERGKLRNVGKATLQRVAAAVLTS
jgi:DNA-binding XRE family transcriptional regulator